MATANVFEEEIIYIGDRNQALDDYDENTIRTEMIKHIKDYKGAPIPPDPSFEENWLTVEAQLRSLMDAGLIPPDSVASSGLDNFSYKAVNMCADTLQSLLYEGEIFNALGNLRGFRRLFSESRDSVLKHAFRGPPLEVLRNIYYGGHGILPEDRMLLLDPFHHMKSEDGVVKYEAEEMKYEAKKVKSEPSSQISETKLECDEKPWDTTKSDQRHPPQSPPPLWPGKPWGTDPDIK